MRCYTYYMPIPMYSEDSQRRLIDIWARSWAKQGWEPILLNEGDAKLHPNYEDFRRAIWGLPTEYGHEYESSCFLRWLAMAAQETDGGGGVLTDYDVVNYRFKPRPVNPEEMYFLSDQVNRITMGVVIGARKHYEFFCNLFANWTPDKHDWNASAGLFHCSDLSMVTRMFEDGTWDKPAWAKKLNNFQAIFGQEPKPNAWRTAPLVHYGYNMKHAGYWPKYSFIETLRPF